MRKTVLGTIMGLALVCLLLRGGSEPAKADSLPLVTATGYVDGEYPFVFVYNPNNGWAKLTADYGTYQATY